MTRYAPSYASDPANTVAYPATGHSSPLATWPSRLWTAKTSAAAEPPPTRNLSLQNNQLKRGRRPPHAASRRQYYNFEFLPIGNNESSLTGRISHRMQDSNGTRATLNIIIASLQNNTIALLRYAINTHIHRNKVCTWSYMRLRIPKIYFYTISTSDY